MTRTWELLVQKYHPTYGKAFQNCVAARKLAGDSAGAIQDLEQVKKWAAKGRLLVNAPAAERPPLTGCFDGS